MSKAKIFFAGLCFGLSAGVLASIGYIKKFSPYDLKQGNMLYSKELDKAYPLRTIDGDLFLGDAMHHLKGAMKVGKYEGMQAGKEAMQSKVSQLEEDKKSLESEVTRNRIGNFIDGIERNIRGN